MPDDRRSLHRADAWGLLVGASGMIESAVRYGTYFALVFGAVLVSVVVLAFCGGLASAAIEVRRERAAGVPVTRPAWDLRRKKRARGRFSTVKALWARAQHRGEVELCWCVLGPVQWFDAVDNSPQGRAGFGCAAWESGLVDAIERHARAGGYARTVDRSQFRMMADA